MFDISFGEIMLIGVIALVVIGPQRLPTVARTVGHLLGRAQRYVNNVKTDIQREIDLDEFNRLKQQMDDASRTVNDSLRETADSLRDPLTQAQRAFDDMAAQTTSRPTDDTPSVSSLPDDFDAFNTPEPAPATPPPAAPAPAAQEAAADDHSAGAMPSHDPPAAPSAEPAPAPDTPAPARTGQPS